MKFPEIYYLKNDYITRKQSDSTNVLAALNQVRKTLQIVQSQGIKFNFHKLQYITVLFECSFNKSHNLLTDSMWKEIITMKPLVSVV